MPPAGLDIDPQDVTANKHLSALVGTLHDTLHQSRHAFYSYVPDGLGLAEAFVARNPDDALRWICSQTTRGKILTLIKDVYEDLAREAARESPTKAAADDAQDATDKADDATEGPHDEPDGARDVTDADGSGRHGVKRKRALREKTTTTRAPNGALAEKKMDLDLVEAEANAPDQGNAKAPAGLLTEEQRYKRFATGLSGVGVNAVAQMIAKASAVGTMDVFRDWQAILAVWKRQSHYGKKLFETVAMPFGECDQAQGNTTVLASPDNQDKDEAGLTAFETEAFAYKYFDAQKTQVDGMADEMRHRWKMDELYEEFDRLEKEIKKRNRGTRGRGVRYSDVAKEHLFSSTYKRYLGRAATKGTDRELWLAFGDYLDWGKRWNVLKKRFGGVGIFGLLPRSLVPNTFVERTLSQARLSQWADMVAECNPDVVQMAARIEPLFLACMDESAPPPEFAFLEHLDGYPQTTRPVTLFLLNQAHDDREGQADRERNVIGDTMQATLEDRIQAEILSNGTAAPSFGQG